QIRHPLAGRKAVAPVCLVRHAAREEHFLAELGDRGTVVVEPRGCLCEFERFGLPAHGEEGLHAPLVISPVLVGRTAKKIDDLIISPCFIESAQAGGRALEETMQSWIGAPGKTNGA